MLLCIRHTKFFFFDMFNELIDMTGEVEWYLTSRMQFVFYHIKNRYVYSTKNVIHTNIFLSIRLLTIFQSMAFLFHAHFIYNPFVHFLLLSVTFFGSVNCLEFREQQQQQQQQKKIILIIFNWNGISHIFLFFLRSNAIGGHMSLILVKP